MEKNQVQTKKSSVNTVAVVLLRYFTDSETKEKREYVSVELPDIFGDEDFRDVVICPKWKDADSVFKFYAKKALRTTDKIEFPIELRVGSYHSDKKRKDVTYPALYGISPFTGRELEFKIKREESSAIFNELARAALGLSTDEQTDTSRETPDDGAY